MKELTNIINDPEDNMNELTFYFEHLLSEDITIEEQENILRKIKTFDFYRRDELIQDEFSSASWIFIIKRHHLTTSVTLRRDNCTVFSNCVL